MQALLNSSHMFMEAKSHMSNYGVLVDNPRVDWAVMQKQKDTAVSGLTKGIEGLLKKNKVRACSMHRPPCTTCKRIAWRLIILSVPHDVDNSASSVSERHRLLSVPCTHTSAQPSQSASTLLNPPP